MPSNNYMNIWRKDSFFLYMYKQGTIAQIKNCCKNTVLQIFVPQIHAALDAINNLYNLTLRKVSHDKFSTYFSCIKTLVCKYRSNKHMNIFFPALYQEEIRHAKSNKEIKGHIHLLNLHV